MPRSTPSHSSRAIRRRTRWRGDLKTARRKDLVRAADPEPVRSAAYPAHRARGREGGDGIRRGDGTDQEFRRNSALLSALRSAPGLVMEAVFAKAEPQPARVIYAEGEDERCCAPRKWCSRRNGTADFGGRPSVVEARLKRFGLSIKAGQDFDLVNPEEIRATAPMCKPISMLPAAAALRPKPRGRWFAPLPPRSWRLPWPVARPMP